jgi:hypothetical protein
VLTAAQERQSPVTVEFDFEKPAPSCLEPESFAFMANEIKQPGGSGWRDFTGSVSPRSSEQEVRAFYTVEFNVPVGFNSHLRLRKRSRIQAMFAH